MIVANSQAVMNDDLWEIEDESSDDPDGIASLKATTRALVEVLEKHNLEEEFEELYQKYLPEEIQKRKDWWAEIVEQKAKKETLG